MFLMPQSNNIKIYIDIIITSIVAQPEAAGGAKMFTCTQTINIQKLHKYLYPKLKHNVHKKNSSEKSPAIFY